MFLFGFGLRIGFVFWFCSPLPKIERILAPDIIFSTECPTVQVGLVCFLFVFKVVWVWDWFTVWFLSPSPLPKLERILAPDIIFSTECLTLMSVLFVFGYWLLVTFGFGLELV